MLPNQRGNFKFWELLWVTAIFGKHVVNLCIWLPRNNIKRILRLYDLCLVVCYRSNGCFSSLQSIGYHYFICCQRCFIYSELKDDLMFLFLSVTSRFSCLASSGSSLFSRDSFSVLSFVGSSQTSHCRRGARLVVRADSVGISNCLL